jgi:hypothetical protein
VDDRDLLERAFRRLTVEQRAVLVFHHYLGLSISEVAVRTDLPVGTAKSRLHHATRALKASIEADARATRRPRSDWHDHTRDPDRLIHAFLLEGAEQLQDQVYDAVRAEIDQKRQRVVLGPWRVPTVSKFLPIGLGAAAVIAVLFIGSRFIGSPSSNVGGPASQAPASTAPSEAPASAAPSPTSLPPLTQTFTSPLHGISVSYPEGWTAEAATEPWTDGPSSHSIDNHYDDRLYHPILTDHLFLITASQPIGDSTPEDWIMEQMAQWEDLEQCRSTEPIAVGEASGLIGSEGCDLAVVTTDGRGYWISLRKSNDDPPPSLRTTEHGSRRSLPRCGCIPRTPWTERRRPYRSGVTPCGRPSGRPRFSATTAHDSPTRSGLREDSLRLNACERGGAKGQPVPALLDLCQLILLRVIDEGQAAAAQGVAERKVGPLDLDAIPVHPPAGHVGKPGLIGTPRLDAAHIGPEPPHAVTDLADVVHAALTAPTTRPTALRHPWDRRSRRRWPTGRPPFRARWFRGRWFRGRRRGVNCGRRAGSNVAATGDGQHQCDEHHRRRPLKSDHISCPHARARSGGVAPHTGRQPPQDTLSQEPRLNRSAASETL